MKLEQAAELVVMLSESYPGATFTDQNADAYERAIIGWEYDRTKEAILRLIQESKYLPSVAEIRQEVVDEQRRQATKAEASRRPPIVDVQGRTMGPRPDQWAAPLGRMLSEAERYDRMARAWYASKGKPYPGDPGLRFVEAAADGARGKDVVPHISSIMPDFGKMAR